MKKLRKIEDKHNEYTKIYILNSNHLHMTEIGSISEKKVDLLLGKIFLGKPLPKEKVDKIIDWMEEEQEKFKKEIYKYSLPKIDNNIYKGY